MIYRYADQNKMSFCNQNKLKIVIYLKNITGYIFKRG